MNDFTQLKTKLHDAAVAADRLGKLSSQAKKRLERASVLPKPKKKGFLERLIS